MKPFLPILFIAALSVLSWSQDKVRLANGEWPPYMSANLPHYGSVSRIVSEAFEQEGVKVSYEFMPWKRSLEQAREGSFDGTLVWVKTDDRQRDFHLSEPVFESIGVFLYRKNRSFDWSNIEDLARYTIGGTVGYSYGPTWEAFVKRYPQHIERAPSDELNLNKLVAGRIDAFAIDREVGYFLLNLHHGAEVAGQIASHGKLLEVNKMYLLLSRRISNGAELQSKFNRGLAKLKASGKIEQYLLEGRQYKPGSK